MRTVSLYISSLPPLPLFSVLSSQVGIGEKQVGICNVLWVGVRRRSPDPHNTLQSRHLYRRQDAESKWEERVVLISEEFGNWYHNFYFFVFFSSTRCPTSSTPSLSLMKYKILPQTPGLNSLSHFTLLQQQHHQQQAVTWRCSVAPNVKYIGLFHGSDCNVTSFNVCKNCWVLKGDGGKGEDEREQIGWRQKKWGERDMWQEEQGLKEFLKGGGLNKIAYLITYKWMVKVRGFRKGLLVQQQLFFLSLSP